MSDGFSKEGKREEDGDITIRLNIVNCVRLYLCVTSLGNVERISCLQYRRTEDYVKP